MAWLPSQACWLALLDFLLAGMLAYLLACLLPGSLDFLLAYSNDKLLHQLQKDMRNKFKVERLSLRSHE